MNRSKKIASRQLIIALGFFIATFAASGQKQTKTFKESFTVAEDAVLDINTSYVDIEFETWNKEVVEITATVSLEGASDEEAETFFKNDPIEILGNSKKIEITSRSKSKGLFSYGDFDFDFGNFDIGIPEVVSSFVMEMPEIAPFPEVMEMPPLPIAKFQFDYEAYRKDGEEYMKKWQKDFEKSFDKEHQKRLEEWAKRMEKRAEEMDKRVEELEKRRSEMMEKRTEKMAERRERLAAVREKARASRDSTRALFYERDSLHAAPNIFYFSSDGENKNYKIKKTLKIMMPKSTRLKMNVRHGEVKLAENTRNLDATLSHSSLWATTIDGDKTNVSASYSPVTVQRWNYGQLQANFSQDVSLAEVLDLQLRAVSSDVTIDKLLKKAFIKNDFGPIQITSIGNDFEEMDISLKNGEFNFNLPSVATAIYVKGNSSKLSTPVGLQLNETKNGNTTVNKGFHLKDKSGRSIIITSDYSDVVVH